VTAPRPHPSTVGQWWVLTVRAIAPTWRNGELLISVVLSGIFTVSYYVPLKKMIGDVVPDIGSYAQYLMPLITLQAIYFSGMSGGLRSAIDAREGINRRFGAMPIRLMTPLAARMSANLYRSAAALMTAIVFGHIIGFRFHRGLGYTVAFCVLALLIGLMVTFVGDLAGAVSKSPEATSYLLLMPSLILIMLSVGIQPVELFPAWIQPFVRDQPFSQFVYALRALAGGAPDFPSSPIVRIVGAALAWLIGIMLIAAPMYAHVMKRPQ
jgi:ABC-2 type transport system permease protein